jgi:hydroxymethylpyrimidine/phosphomethylpyrimidine kinase
VTPARIPDGIGTPERAGVPRVLSIAGSDSGGGAGIQADLKAFAACAVHGMTAITAITAQNTRGVSAVHHIPGEMIIEQVRMVQSDIGIDAVKVGMLGNRSTIEAVARALDRLAADTPVVLDPVMVAESGAELLDPSAREALIELLLPRATVVTPNVPEAKALVAAGGPGKVAGASTQNGDDLSSGWLARRIRDLGPRVVVVTGGHREDAIDVFFDGERLEELAGERQPGGATHGSGCTHSSVLAARLAWGDDPLEAARAAKSLASRAVRDGLREIGTGAGPVDVLGLAARAIGGEPTGLAARAIGGEPTGLAARAIGGEPTGLAARAIGGEPTGLAARTIGGEPASPLT